MASTDNAPRNTNNNGGKKGKKNQNPGFVKMIEARRKAGLRVGRNAPAPPVSEEENNLVTGMNTFSLNSQGLPFVPSNSVPGSFGGAPVNSFGSMSNMMPMANAMPMVNVMPGFPPFGFFPNTVGPGFTSFGQNNSSVAAQTSLPVQGKPPPPQANIGYLTQAAMTPVPVKPRPLLIVLDVNGTLGYRRRASQSFLPRPYLKEFLDYCFANHKVLIWSSAMPGNLNPVCRKALTAAQQSEVLGIWGRDTLGLSSADYHSKVQVYKRLDMIWSNPVLQSAHPDFMVGGMWGQHNTVLVDDSAAKAISQPFNHIEVPEFAKFTNFQESDVLVLKQVQEYLEQARCWSDVSQFIKHSRLTFVGTPFVATSSTVPGSVVS